MAKPGKVPDKTRGVKIIIIVCVLIVLATLLYNAITGKLAYQAELREGATAASGASVSGAGGAAGGAGTEGASGATGASSAASGASAASGG
ncbi:MAG: hypothetical protein ACRYG5_18175 [Janthinobacterium lividum]